MKRNLLVLVLLFTGFMVSAQNEHWTIKLNGVILLTASKEDMANNQKTIPASQWNKTGKLEIRFTEAGNNTTLRAIYLTDELENQVWKKDSVVSASIPLSTLRKLTKGKKHLKIYIIKSPPSQMMGRRTQLLHLCTLKLA